MMLRLITTGILILVNLVLIRYVKPSNEELRSGLVTATVIAVSDFVFEFLMGSFKIWQYHAAFSFLGLPIDLFVDVFFLALAFSIGLVFFKRMQNARLWVKIYTVAAILFLGTEAYFKNKSAAASGFISFSKMIDITTPIFLLGNYILIALEIILLLIVYRFIFKALGRKSK